MEMHCDSKPCKNLAWTSINKSLECLEHFTPGSDIIRQIGVESISEIDYEPQYAVLGRKCDEYVNKLYALIYFSLISPPGCSLTFSFIGILLQLVIAVQVDCDWTLYNPILCSLVTEMIQLSCQSTLTSAAP